jgi:adenosylhomocysteine nucleosidase
MAILYVAAEPAELKPFASTLTGLRKLNWPIDYAFEGIWEGRRVMLAANGAGPRLAERAVEVAIRAVTAAELSSSKLEWIVSAGFCGALDPELREGQIVVASDVLDLALNESFPSLPIESDRKIITGTLVSQDRIAISSAEKAKLRSLNAIAVDMESSGVASRAKRAHLPFSCIKVVTDRADESFRIDLNALRTSEGRIARGKIGLYALTHPKLMPDLLNLRRRAKDAAERLGEFLVSSRIIPDANSAPAQ